MKTEDDEKVKKERKKEREEGMKETNKERRPTLPLHGPHSQYMQTLAVFQNSGVSPPTLALQTASPRPRIARRSSSA